MKRIEYIESTGTQYIDTGFKANQNTGVEAKLNVTSLTANGTLYCSRTTSTVSFTLFLMTSGKHFRTDYNSSQITLTDTITNGVDYEIKEDKNKFYVDGVLKATHPTATFSSSYNMILFASNHYSSSNQGLGNYGKFKLYYLRIYDNDTLVRYFIPVEDDDGVACLLDLITGNYFYNQGTGTFTKGPRIPQYTEIEYIQGDGSSYIDTGYKHNQNTRIVADIDFQATFTWEKPFGSWGDANVSPQKRFAGEYNGSRFNSYYGRRSTLYFTKAQCVGRKIWDWNKNVFKIDTVTKTFTADTFQSLYNFIIFGITGYDGAVNTSNSYMKLYSFKIYDNDTLIRDYIPVLDKDDVPCLYDKVNDTYYYNQGTGNFIGGEIMPRTFLDYSGLYTLKTNLDNELATKQNTLTAGNDITIAQDGTIAVDTVAITDAEIDACFE